MPRISRETDTRRGRRLEHFTLGWNVTEAAVGIAAGVLAGSIALVGFGVDSVIESLASVVLLWRLQSHEADARRGRGRPNRGRVPSKRQAVKPAGAG